MRFFQRLIQRILSFPQSLYRATIEPLTRPGFLGHQFRRFTRSVWMLFTSPYRLFEQLGQASLARLSSLSTFWWRNQRLADLLRGAFGICTLVLLGILYLFGISQSEVELAGRYDRAAKEAIRSGDLEKAQLMVRREIQLGRNSDETLFEMAQLALNTGDRRLGERLIYELAPDDSPGFVEAHLFRARTILEQPKLDNPDFNAARQQLAYVLQQNPSHPVANPLQARLFLKFGLYKKAIEHFTMVDERYLQPENMLRLAYCYQQQDRRQESVRAAGLAARAFGEQYARNPEDLELLQRYIEAMQTAELFEEAIEALQNAEIPNQADAVIQLWAQTLIRWNDAIEKGNQPGGLKRQLELVEKALMLSPKMLDVYDALVALIGHPRASAETKERIREDLMRAEADGAPPAIVQFLLGVEAGSRRDWSEANDRYRQSLSYNKNFVVAANNLAFGLIQLNPPELEEAEQVIKSAVSMGNVPPAIRDTYGQILALKGDYAEARTQLVLARHAMPDDIGLLQSLQKVYEKLDQQEEAAITAERIRQILRRSRPFDPLAE